MLIIARLSISRTAGWMLALLVLVAGAGGCAILYHPFEPGFRGPPGEMQHDLSPEARQFIRDSVDGIDTDRFVDLHVHMGSRHFHPSLTAWHRPLRRAGMEVMQQAAGVDHHGPGMEEEYLQRLVDLIRHSPLYAGQYFLYALDRYYDRDGNPIPDKTQMYVPNSVVIDAARRYPNLFVPVVSVHPHRRDAIEALDRYAALGVRYIKWLPNTIGIDPSLPELDPFYQRMSEHDMVLLAHTGGETPLQAEDQNWGNPQLLRRAMDQGVRVVALHAAGNGEMPDLDSPDREKVEAFKLMLRMLDDPQYEDLFYVETSSNTFFNHLDRPLQDLLAREDLHPRIIHGSDYPLPGVNLSTWNWQLAARGYITSDEQRHLTEIQRYNPLLFDFLVKRTVRHPETGQQFSPEVFTLPEDFPSGRLTAY